MVTPIKVTYLPKSGEHADAKTIIGLVAIYFAVLEEWESCDAKDLPKLRFTNDRLVEVGDALKKACGIP